MDRSSARRAVVFVAFGGATALACSALTDFSGLLGDAPSGDASLDRNAASDASIPSVDAGTDSSDASTRDVGIDSGPAFCADAAGLAFCDDFDDAREGGLFASWDSTETTVGTLAIDPGNAVSLPSSLLATVPADNPQDGPKLSKTFSGHTRATLSADVLLEATDDSSYVSTIEIHLDPDPDGYGDYRVALIFTSGAMTLDVYATPEDGGAYQSSTAVALDFTQWQRVSIELGTNPTPYALARDGNGNMLATLRMPSGVIATGQRVVVGLPYVRSNGMPWRGRIDNVTVTLGD